MTATHFIKVSLDLNKVTFDSKDNQNNIYSHSLNYNKDYNVTMPVHAHTVVVFNHISTNVLIWMWYGHENINSCICPKEDHTGTVLVGKYS